MARVSTKALVPYWPYSRLTPEYLKPPHGACGSSVIPLITTRPARSGDAHLMFAVDVRTENGGVQADLRCAALGRM